MENSSKALLIAGAILVAILIISICIYTFGNASDSVQSSINSFSTHEIEAFNNQFLMYNKTLDGTEVKKLIEKLVINSSTYENILDKIPSFIIDNQINANSDKVENAMRPTNSQDISEYTSKLNSIKNKIESNHKYTIEMINDATGFIGEIKLIY